MIEERACGYANALAGLQMLNEIVADPGCVAVLGVAGVNYPNVG